MSKYLKHVDRSVRRLGYLKPECVPRLAGLMDEHEGQHPHQIARKFRQIGAPLSRDEKKTIGLRTNADMTAEALAALTAKGRQSPVRGLEATLLDASFAYFRHRSIGSLDGTELATYAKYVLSAAWKDCAGCVRLEGSEVDVNDLDDLPPYDCERETCALSIRADVDFIQKFVDGEKDEQMRKTAPKQSWFSRLLRR